MNQKIERIIATDLKGVSKELNFDNSDPVLIKVDISNCAQGTFYITIHTSEKSIAVVQPILVN